MPAYDDPRYPRGFSATYCPHYPPRAPEPTYIHVENLHEEFDSTISVDLDWLRETYPTANHISIERDDDNCRLTIEHHELRDTPDYEARMAVYNRQLAEYTANRAAWEALSKQWKEEQAKEDLVRERELYLRLKAKFEPSS